MAMAPHAWFSEGADAVGRWRRGAGAEAVSAEWEDQGAWQLKVRFWWSWSCVHFARMCFAFLHLIAPLCSKLNCPGIRTHTYVVGGRWGRGRTSQSSTRAQKAQLQRQQLFGRQQQQQQQQQQLAFATCNTHAAHCETQPKCRGL